MKIKWHKYPETKPNKEDVYLVTYESNKVRGVYIGYWSGSAIKLVDEEYWISKPNIIFWAELPEPCGEKNENA